MLKRKKTQDCCIGLLRSRYQDVVRCARDWLGEYIGYFGFPSGSVVKNPPVMQETQVQFSRGWKIPWRRKWQPTTVFLPGKYHGQMSLVGYSPWHGKKSQTGLSD